MILCRLFHFDIAYLKRKHGKQAMLHDNSQIIIPKQVIIVIIRTKVRTNIWISRIITHGTNFMVKVTTNNVLLTLWSDGIRNIFVAKCNIFDMDQYIYHYLYLHRMLSLFLYTVQLKWWNSANFAATKFHHKNIRKSTTYGHQTLIYLQILSILNTKNTH